MNVDRPYMPGYGLAPATGGRGLLPWSWADDRLAAARRYWIATVGADGRPHLAAVWGLWADGAFHFSTGGASRKARDLRHDPRVAVSVEGASESLVLDGVAERVIDPSVLGGIESRYIAKYGSGYPDPADNPLMVVRPRTVIAVLESEPDFTELATRWTFAPDEAPTPG
jgi:PPOX class probable F420-dependent enzyme